MQRADALNVVRELFHVAYWFGRTYARHEPPHPQLVFNPDAPPKTTPLPKQTVDQLLKLEASDSDATARALTSAITDHAHHKRGPHTTLGVIAACRGNIGEAT